MFVGLHAFPPNKPKKLCGRILCPAFLSFMANSESICTSYNLSGDLLPTPREKELYHSLLSILCHQNLRGAAATNPLVPRFFDEARDLIKPLLCIKYF